VSVVAAGNSAGSGDVVLISDTGAVVTKPNSFTYLSRGNISLVSPARGQLGTVVAIYGDGLLGGGTSLVSVSLNGVAPEEVLSVTDNVIKIRANEARPGLGAIRIVSNTGSVVEQDNGWTYDVPSNITGVCVAA
jgi:hypothetical protein